MQPGHRQEPRSPGARAAARYHCPARRWPCRTAPSRCRAASRGGGHRTMTDFEHRLRTVMHSAVDAEDASPGQLIKQVRRRHRRHTALVVTAALAAILAVPAAIATYGAIVRSSPPPVTHKITPKPHSLPSQLSGLPMPIGTELELQFLDQGGGWATA